MSRTSVQYRRHLPPLAATAVCLALSAPPARADDLGPGLKLSGFGTVGVVHQSVPEGWGFLRNSAQPGLTRATSLAPDSRAGVQADWRPRSDLEATLQAVLYERPEGTPRSEAIEWAYVGWRPTPNARLRLGRTSPDIFLFANSRHVGYALPWIRPPVDMYGFLPIHSVNGLEGSQQWQAGDATWLLRGAAGRFSATGGGTVEPFERVPLTGKHAVALTAQRETETLLVKASVAEAHLGVSQAGQLMTLIDVLAPLAALPIPGLAGQLAPFQSGLWTGGTVRYSSLGLQYDPGPWLLHAEFSRLQAAGGSLLPSRRGYVSLGLRWREATLYAMAGRMQADRPAVHAPALQAQLEPVVGAAAAAQAQGALDAAASVVNSYRYDQSTVSFGVRWDVAPNLALKAQLDRSHVRPDGAAMWRNPGSAAGAVNTTAAVALDFVWGP